MKPSYSSLCRRLAPIYGGGEAKAIVRMLLEDGFSMSLADALCGGVEALGYADAARLEAMAARLERSEPIQYVLGRAEFGGRTFAVGPGVLIPRPETWQLCQMASAFLRGLDCSRPAALDIGTGSGCIAVSIALGSPSAKVAAWDISPEALAVAGENASRLGAEVEFECRDALDPPHDERRWNIVVSNPPYICDSERAEMDENVVAYEPSKALFVPDSDPLLFYRSIGRYALRSLKPGGALMFETNERYAEATAEMLRTAGFGQAKVHCDMFGKPRFVAAKMEAELTL